MFFKKDHKDDLNVEIQRVIAHMSELDPSSDMYAACSKNLELLAKSSGESHSRTPQSEVILAAAANLIGMALVLNFEKTGIIVSKAFNMIGKVK